MIGLIFDDATCELVAPPPPPKPRVRDYIWIVPDPVGISMAAIRDAVAEHYGLSRFDMIAARRAVAISHPRQLAMYLCRNLTPRSYPEIGRAFGGRDHSTVHHAIKAVEARLATNADLRAAHDAILEALGE